MNKRVTFKWASATASRAAVRLYLVQGGQLLAGTSLTAGDRQAIEAWITATKFKGKAGTVVWPQTVAGIVLAGIGPSNEFHAARWLRTWAAVGRAISAR